MTLKITDHIVIDENELTFSFSRSPGPGGQNVNKVESGVQLRFDVARSPNLTAELRARLARIAGGRLTRAGVLVINAHRFRTQPRNRADAIQRLVDMLRQAAVPPKPRRATRPSAAADRRRLQHKRQRAQVKQQRRLPTED